MNDYSADVEAILSHRFDQGGDHWTTPDRRLLKGAPFSTIECVNYLLELGLFPDAPEVSEALGLIFDAWREDGRFKLCPTGGILPCHTTAAAQVLCRAGLADDPRVQATLDHLLASRWKGAGWRCNKFSYGRGPETEHSNPLPTLQALDAFRSSRRLATDDTLNGAVEFLLEHWAVKAPIGPCHYGIGTLFMQVEYPFRSYNLFYWVYVLSFYETARTDPRFLEAYEALTSRTIDGQIVVERVVPKLATLSFCAKGRPSELATRRYEEIAHNLA
ncbi:MAG: hypothetical protein QM708_14815 [Propioniciclava sp.]|uniref:hypothetical protein n=1 Tax=Propioniciclava sp. TaxID=2038686 RepID=UPI0039E46D40